VGGNRKKRAKNTEKLKIKVQKRVWDNRQRREGVTTKAEGDSRGGGQTLDQKKNPGNGRRPESPLGQTVCSKHVDPKMPRSFHGAGITTVPPVQRETSQSKKSTPSQKKSGPRGCSLKIYTKKE